MPYHADGVGLAKSSVLQQGVTHTLSSSLVLTLVSSSCAYDFQDVRGGHAGYASRRVW